MNIEVQPHLFSFSCCRIESQGFLLLLNLLSEEGISHPVSGLGLSDVGVWRKQGGVVCVANKLLEIADPDV